MHPLHQTGPAIRAERRSRFAQRGLRSVAYALVFSVCAALAFDQSFQSTLVYSLCISTLCWFFIDAGRIAVARWLHRRAPAGSPEAESNWPGWPWMGLVVVLGTIVGFSLGNEIANRLTGFRSPGFFDGDMRRALALLVGSMMPGVAITYWFYSRETMAAQAAAVQVAQRQAAEHQLKLLESQLEPHMLFNTLANLRVLIALDPARAQAMLDQLIAFLRATLSASRQSQPGQHLLGAEFARLADYLALMQVRMGGRLQTRFDLPEALAAAPVPPLLLQPLVENCIKHGLEPKVAGGRIAVSAALDGGSLVLQVRDTGVGLPATPGAAGIDAVSGSGRSAGNGSGGTSSDAAHFGLAQVRERLATLYGTRASLQLTAAGDAEGGTLAIVKLPLSLPLP